MKPIELWIEKLLLASRWVLVVFYLGLAVALLLYAIAFLGKLGALFVKVFSASEADMILAMLGLIDAALVGSLVVMVMLSSYENFVGRFDDERTELSWLGKLGVGSLKIKLASAIVAISSIHLLAVFLNINEYTWTQALLLTGIHLSFVVSAVFLAYIDRWQTNAKGP